MYDLLLNLFISKSVSLQRENLPHLKVVKRLINAAQMKRYFKSNNVVKNMSTADLLAILTSYILSWYDK